LAKCWACQAAKPRASGRSADAEDVLELVWLLLRSIVAGVRPRQDLVLENVLLRHQLAVLARPTRTRRRARLHTSDKVLWVLARRWCASWREHLSFVTPERVVRWHQQGWRLFFWRWKSRSRGGRPHLSREVRDLIGTMSRESRLWGTEWIRGELLKLGITVSNRSIRRYRWRGPAHSPSQTWRTFLANYAYHLWAADLFTVTTLTFKTLYVLVFIAHSRRELVHVIVTSNPTAAWVWRGRSRRHRGEPVRATCCAIGMTSTGMISASEPSALVSTPLPRRYGHRVQTLSPSASSAHYGETVWTT
jgi:hypothetical protein